MALENYIVRVGDRRWKIRTCRSLTDALHEIAHARCLGSIGGSSTVYQDGAAEVVADVVQVNSDNTDRQPYVAAH